MEIVVDLIAVALLILFAVFGIKDGFAKTFISTFGTILSLVFACLLCSYTATFLESKFSLVSKISDNLVEPLSNVFGAEVMSLRLGDVNGSTSISSFLLGIITRALSNGNVDADKTVSEVICPIFGYYITIVISVIIMFILFKILFFVIGQIVKKAKDIKIVDGLDKALGLVLGVIRGIVFIDIIILIISIIPVPIFQNIMLLIDNSKVTALINNANVFNLIIKIIASPIAFI